VAVLSSAQPPAFPDAEVKRWTCATALLLCLGQVGGQKLRRGRIASRPSRHGVLLPEEYSLLSSETRRSDSVPLGSGPNEYALPRSPASN
jgi:hypothetical protein